MGLPSSLIKIWVKSSQEYQRYRQTTRQTNRDYNFILYIFITKAVILHTVVVVFINTMKTTFDLNFDFYQAFKHHGYRYKYIMDTDTNTSWIQIQIHNGYRYKYIMDTDTNGNKEKLSTLQLLFVCLKIFLEKSQKSKPT